jgi:RNA polymerase sigma factor (sigma-70 family)
VLLVDDSLAPSPSVARALSSLQCEWRYAASCEEALAAMEERTFRLVLSKFKLADGSGRRLIPAVQIASAWLFLSFQVEEGCWWIPVIEAGRLSAKAAALHSREFRSALVKIVKATVRTRREQRERIGSHALQQVSYENQLLRPEFRKDWALVQRAIAGDTHCQTNLFAPYRGRLYRAAFAVLRNKEDAEDAVQDGLCKAFASLRSFQGRSTLSTWLTSIVKNAGLMALRRKKSRPETSLDELLEDRSETLTHVASDARPDPEQTCAAGEVRMLVEKRLRELSPALQVAVRLRITKAHSTAELARALGISAGAFKSRISRARRRMACELWQSLAPLANAENSQGCREVQAKLGTRKALGS